QPTQPPPASNAATDGTPAVPALPALPSTSRSTSTVTSASGSGSTTATASTVTPFTLAAKLATALLSLKTDMQGVEYAALTGDGWTSRVADHYLTLTVHFMKDGELNVRVLQTLKAEVSQTGDNTAAEIGQCLEDFSLKGKVEVMTTDDAKAMINAMTSAGILLSLNCFAHTVNLSIQKAMSVPTVVRMLAVVLQEKQKALGKPSHSLILDCKTRWNSSYMMVERVVEQYLAVVAASLDDRLKKDSFKKLQRCSDQDIEKMERFLSVMKLPYKITVAMSAEERPTSGQVLPMMEKVKHHLAEKEDDDKFSKGIKGAIRKDLLTHYQEDTRTEFLQEATALDPRFKGSPVVTKDVVVTHVEPPVPVRLRVQAEILKFKSLPKLKSTDDVIALWQGKADELPLLSRHARKYLIVPGTSVPSECVFSTAGDVVSAERATLDPDGVNMLLFLNNTDSMI
uniref:HAT C-terminal dimerisation domain-containing protein n=1 Tax=Sphaeramia orbicularis TaxID=375764 RepID=A0A673ACK5_9TELE